jgi:hypothetical protein
MVPVRIRQRARAPARPNTDTLGRRNLITARRGDAVGGADGGGALTGGVTVIVTVATRDRSSPSEAV